MIPAHVLEHLRTPGAHGWCATADEARLPRARETFCWRVDESSQRVTVFFNAAHDVGLPREIEAGHRIALTTVTTTAAYQLKGRLVEQHRPNDDDRAYFERFVAGFITFALEYGYPEPAVHAIIGQPSMGAVFEVDEVFEQTPGPGAGQRIAPSPLPKLAEPPGEHIPRTDGIASAKLPEQVRAATDNGIPAVIASCSADGTPNLAFISKVYYIDPQRVALSFQFFNKTIRNVRANPVVAVGINDPQIGGDWVLRLLFSHSETEGPIFEEMDMAIEAIASQTGMSGIFKLRAADIYHVQDVEQRSCGD